MKDKEYYIKLISRLLYSCNADTVKAVYIVICNMTERSKSNATQRLQATYNRLAGKSER